VKYHAASLAVSELQDSESLACLWRGIRVRCASNLINISIKGNKNGILMFCLSDFFVAGAAAQILQTGERRSNASSSREGQTARRGGSWRLMLLARLWMTVI
jgi:hypothetical protein